MDALQSQIVTGVFLLLAVIFTGAGAMLGLAGAAGKTWASCVGCLVAALSCGQIYLGRFIFVLPVVVFLFFWMSGGKLRKYSDGIGAALLLSFCTMRAWADTVTPDSTMTDLTDQAVTGIGGWGSSIHSIGAQCMVFVLIVAGILVAIGLVLRIANKV